MNYLDGTGLPAQPWLAERPRSVQPLQDALPARIETVR
jgi:hypothetical protein